MRSTSPFTRFAQHAATTVGRPWAFLVAAGTIVVWAATGPVFHFSDTWQLLINTGTTIVTFLMVFLIQNQQNRDSLAIQIKLDELIRTTHGAHLALLELEHLDDRDIDRIRADYEALAADARQGLRKGRADTGAPQVGRRRKARRRS